MKRTYIITASLICMILITTSYADQKQTEITIPQQAFELRMAGKTTQAKDLLDAYLKEHPDDPAAQYEYSRIQYYLFDFKSAAEHAEDTIELDKNNPRCYFWKGNCNAVLFIDQAHHKDNLQPDLLKRSIGEYQKAVELKPDYYDARLQLITMLADNPPEYFGNMEEARKHTEYLMKKDLEYGLKATVIVNKDRSVDWKIQQYQQALAKEPDIAGLHAGVALLYLESDQMPKFQEHLDKALELDKKQMDVLLTAAFRLAGKQNMQEAEKLVRRYLDKADQEPAAMRAYGMHYLAVILRRSGDQEEFAKVAQQMTQTDPNVWRTMQPPTRMLFEPLDEVF